MSSRRSSAIATADASLQGSRSGSPNDLQVDTSMTDLTNIEGSASSSSYIQRSPQLDIAFLHSISTHRPLGPHKHFNVIPVLITLDRTIRQIGARMRDASTSEPLEEFEEENSDEDQSSNKRRRNDRSPSTSRKAIKKEDTDEDILLDASYMANTSAIQVDSEMVWQRLSELYDLEGLEELEDGAVDGEDDSPFYTSPPPTYFSVATRKVLGEKIKSKPAFGFGSSLVKLPDSATPTPTKSSGRQQKQSRSKAAAAQDDDEEDEEEDERIADFELGPWEDYEDLIAPRRLKSYAPDEGQIDSDEDLSEPSTEQKVASGVQDEDDDIEAKEEDEDEESEEDDEDEDEDEDDDVDEDDEEEEKKPSRRKGSSSSRRAPANSRRKSGTASATPTATASASASASTRTSRSSAKPRRSGRR
jgi:Chromatin modification-related protein EAF7